MMNFEKFKYIYFIGIGGIGMSALARYFNNKNVHIFGYDKVKSDLCEELESEGMNIHYIDDIKGISDIIIENKEESLVIYTPAISSENKIITYFRENHFTIMKRSEVLGVITQDHFTIAVAGTHGKTTTSCMLAHILDHAGLDCTAFLGGISKNYQSNLIFGTTESIVVIEADEFDRSFLFLCPDIAIITSIDADHLDIYNDKESLLTAFTDFSYKLKQGGTIFLEKEIDSSIITRDDISILKYSANLTSDYNASNIICDSGKMYFDVNYQNEKIKDFQLNMIGEYNVSNAVASISVAKLLGVSNEKIVSGINTFEGIKRRSDTHIDTNELVFIDDYAHHPKEIKESILAVKQMYPGRRVTVIFQPHLFSRTRDFLDDFATALSLSDNLILLDIYAAREEEIDGVTSKLLLDKCMVENKKLSNLSEVTDLLLTRNIDVLLTLGAGDISTIVHPIKNILS